MEQLALGTLLPAFQGTSVPDWVRSALDRGLAGVTLFGMNISDNDQLRRLNASLVAASRHTPLISLDEEGGDVTRIGYWTGSRYPGNAALGVVDDVEVTRRVHEAIGADLARVGVNLDLAPSGDVNAVAENPVIGTRAFGSDPHLVARHTAAAIRGLQAAGIAACVKHFPGHGATHQDSHLVVPAVDASIELLNNRELVPFRAAIQAGTKTLMSAHVSVPEITGSEPSTLSSAMLTTLLRKELGFDGVVITDALDMRAITDRWGLAGGAVQSLIAGTDLICLGPIPTPEQVEEIVAAIVGAVREGRLPLARLEESAERVAALREWIDSQDSVRTAKSSEPESTDLGLNAARRAVQVSGTLPNGSKPPYVVEISTPPTIAVGEVPWGLSSWFSDAVRIDPAGELSPEEVVAQANGRSLVIVVRDAHRNDDCRGYAEQLLALRPESTIVEMALPIWRPASGAYIATYGAATVNAQAAAELLLPGRT